MYLFFILGLGRKLTEHRVESTISVATCLIGLIFGALAHKTGTSRRLFAAIGLVSMLISCKLYISSGPCYNTFILKMFLGILSFRYCILQSYS